MISSILFLIIGFKLNILNGWYLMLIIIKMLLAISKLIANSVKIGSKL